MWGEVVAGAGCWCCFIAVTLRGSTSAAWSECTGSGGAFEHELLRRMSFGQVWLVSGRMSAPILSSCMALSSKAAASFEHVSGVKSHIQG